MIMLSATVSKATHNRAGEITYNFVTGLTYEITVLTYTRASSTAADRDWLTVCWGDGGCDSIFRVASSILPNDVKENRYVRQHTYPGPGTYDVTMEDPNRIDGVANVPNSVNIPFFLRSTIYINPFLGPNNSPDLLYKPIDRACLTQVFLHNPNAYDIDGDSLHFELVPSLTTGGQQINGYFFPPAAITLNIDAITGQFTWDNPMQIGDFNIAILISEFRNGQLVGRILRDMQITVEACPNKPPVIEPPNDTCVLAGTFLIDSVFVSDPDNNLITLRATGGPFEEPSPLATFPGANNQPGRYGARFEWQTDCVHVRKEPYQVVFQATDNATNIPLTDLKPWRITVIAPGPDTLFATSSAGAITVTWPQSPCPQAIGYYIYRKQGPSGWEPGDCEVGVPAYTGFQRIGTVNSINTLTFTDNDNGVGLISGVEYCYRVTAFFPLVPQGGVESKASPEVCQIVRKDIPQLTNVDIEVTDPTNGQIFVAWSKPAQLDTVQFFGGYGYDLYRYEGQVPTGNGTLVTSSNSLTFGGLNDTTFVDAGLNTQDIQYSYRVALRFNDTARVGISKGASSVRMSLAPSDQALTLNWSYNVPWTNDSVVIYKLDPILNDFLVLDTVSARASFVDTGLLNGVSYCYYVKTIGSYSSPGFASPLFNKSQRQCAAPIDRTPPCPPGSISHTSDCEALSVSVAWTYPENCTRDVLQYNLYFAAAPPGSAFRKVDSISVSELSLTYLAQNTIAGCYAITALDSAGNESLFSDSFCVDNCPVLLFPNVFTPNGDGINDTWGPIAGYRGVENVKLTILNRWGQRVFSATTPNQRWDGNINGRAASAGAYFFIAEIEELRLAGPQTRLIRGSLRLID